MCQEIFFIILARAISGIPMPEFACYRDSWGERSCRSGTTALHSVSVNWTRNLPTERWNSTTELSPPQRNILRQCPWCHVMLWCAVGGVTEEPTTGDKRIKLALIIYRDFIQNYFIRFWEEGQYQPRTTAALIFASPQSNVISFFLFKEFWLSWRKWLCLVGKV